MTSVEQQQPVTLDYPDLIWTRASSRLNRKPWNQPSGYRNSDSEAICDLLLDTQTLDLPPSMPLSLKIGEKLERAALLSPSQIAVVLQDQQFNQNLLFGEILLLRQWIQEDVLHFFLYLEYIDTLEFKNLPLGQRLRWAGLISELQLYNALEIHRKTRIKLGRILVRHNGLNPKTIDFIAGL